MKLTFLGTGTSIGVPTLRCSCPTCTSTDPRDKRMRASAFLEVGDGGPNLLIDCSPDVWHQLLRAGSPQIDAILLTHIHYDHVGGLDDMRPYCTTEATTWFNPRTMRPKHRKIPVYCRHDVAMDIKERIPYCFAESPYPGVPGFDMHIIQEWEPFEIGGTNILPLPVTHAPGMTILSYKIGKDLAYVTDCKVMKADVVEALKGVDTLVINALRPQPHPAHLSLDEAIDLVRKIGPRQAFLTHMSHDMPPYNQAVELLPPGITLAYDTLSIHTK